MEKPKQDAAAGFVGSVFKYSISTFANIGILGLSMLLTGLFISPENLGQINLFIGWTGTIMTAAILGLDQSLVRFFYEPPKNLSSNGLFRLCFYFSSLVLLLLGTFASTFLLSPIYVAIGFFAVGQWAVPLLFLNAFFFMLARYFNMLYRMEANIALYTAESILMQFFYRLFYVLGAFVWPKNPVPAMMLCSAGGLFAFALIFSFMRRSVLRPQKGEFKKANYAAILPYGFAVAPTALMLSLNTSISQSLLTHWLGAAATGVYGYAVQLSNIVSMVQGGFASFWGAYMFANYKTQQPRIKRVHNYLNFVVLCFFAVLVALEDIIFIILPQYAAVKQIFPLMMLSAVFTILCETTVYGNAIARRPIYDTIGFGLCLFFNLAFVLVLTPLFGLVGAAAALAIANFIMFAFRTYTAQRLYSSVENPKKTAVAIALAVFLAILGTFFANYFLAKLAISAVFFVLFCLVYKRQLLQLLQLAKKLLKNLFRLWGI